MINGKSILAIIPARGGSKSIPRKNIKLLSGKPLIAWTIEEAKKSEYIDRLILSSEDEEIINISKVYGCEVPFIRPEKLSQDDTPGIEPVKHAINSLPEKYNYICLLQPTSPLRKVQDIDGCIKKCILNKAKSCVSVSEVTTHPYWMYRISATDKLTPLFDDKLFATRQALPKVYELNGAIYIASVEQILETGLLVNKDTISFIMDGDFSIDIDNPIDFDIAERMIKKENEL